VRPDDLGPAGWPGSAGPDAGPSGLGVAELGLEAAVVDMLPTGVIVLDAADQVLLANPAAVTMTGLSGSAPGSVREELLRLAAACRASGRRATGEVALPPRVRAPLRRPPRDSELLAARVQARPVDGAPGTVVLLLTDLSDQRRVDAVRRDFVANVSHELKTPVGALQLLAETIGDSSDEPETVRRFAARMLVESSRLTRLVQELIDLSRLQGAEPMVTREDVALAAVIAESVDRVGLAAESKGITVAVSGDADVRVKGDARQLVMAVSNLLENAVAYSPPGTNVGVTVSLADEHDAIEIAVRDEGIGISRRNQQRIFERFFRVDPARSRETGGTGLGLAIVKHVATNHGGTVSVWSAEGAGSTFTLRIPADSVVSINSSSRST
jgi:two-component system sensor histidine kinase SenX3